MEPADTCGVNIRKRVNEILAEASGCLSAAKEKARPQDFMITTYDVLSPEETPQPGKHTLFRFYESGIYLRHRTSEACEHPVQIPTPTVRIVTLVADFPLLPSIL
jgi:hypothetical protein